MSLTENQKQLIRYIAENNMPKAKMSAIACIAEDHTQKNRQFCEHYEKKLKASGLKIFELPYDLKGILMVEELSDTFRESRYYLSEREQSVLEHILRMRNVNEKLMELGITYLNSTLLYGESGTGKTTFGRYLAYKTGLPFAYLNFTNLINSQMGGTAKNISKAFSFALSNPCVLMLDEIDCISLRRSDSNSGSDVSGEMARITIALMQELDKLPNTVIVLSATNRVDRIDDALLRRFSLKHEVVRLNKDEREAMVQKFFDDIAYEISEYDLKRLCEESKTQATLTNEMVQLLVDKIAKEKDLENMTQTRLPL